MHNFFTEFFSLETNGEWAFENIQKFQSEQIIKPNFNKKPPAQEVYEIGTFPKAY